MRGIRGCEGGGVVCRRAQGDEIARARSRMLAGGLSGGEARREHRVCLHARVGLALGALAAVG